VRIITEKRLDDYAAAYAGARRPLQRWRERVLEAGWRNLVETRRTFPHADEVVVASGRPVPVFNVAGNNYRLITAIHYDRQRVFVLGFLTHAEYDRDTWKQRP
jgi:mRNA interferase HigB